MRCVCPHPVFPLPSALVHKAGCAHAHFSLHAPFTASPTLTEDRHSASVQWESWQLLIDTEWTYESVYSSPCVSLPVSHLMPLPCFTRSPLLFTWLSPLMT
mmetsp:Transcript_1479/g.3066  ORF Transcript_1479/g.3066 Transcript_1479/m.3066 type:complete len:101 (+) Transcript_1479:2145-2447(+)